MVFAILAAGEGSRLAQEGVEVPKPLVKINGVPMIDRLLGVFGRAGAEKVVIIANNLHPATQQHLQQLKADGMPIELVVKTTPSSMHSFYELKPHIGEGKFCLTTVDTIFREEEFLPYIQAFQKSEDDGLMAVTDYIDDEKPLYVGTNDALQITGFFDTCEQPKYISGGIYGLTPKAIPVLQRCIERGESRMRNFQRALVADGLLLKAYPFSKVLDIDHASDIQKAEDFL